MTIARVIETVFSHVRWPFSMHETSAFARLRRRDQAGRYAGLNNAVKKRLDGLGQFVRAAATSAEESGQRHPSQRGADKGSDRGVREAVGADGP